MSPVDFDARMREIADSLTRPSKLDDALDRITAAAVETVPGADYASISTRHPDDRLETSAATGDLPRRMDEMQYELREGPCYETVVDDDEAAVYSADVGDDGRWPRFGARAADAGLRSQLAIQLDSRDGTAMSLNLYSQTADAFREDRDLAQLFASHARVALGFAAELKTLQGAVGTREVIGKAIGILMFKYNLTSERAFEFLVRLSQNSNIKLRDVAARIVAQPRDRV